MGEILFGSKVKIVGGFYKGSEGIAVDKIGDKCYVIELSKLDDRNMIRRKEIKISGLNLELVYGKEE